jgi:hypothetical protein
MNSRTVKVDDIELTPEQHTEALYEYNRYCLYCFEPVTFERFVERKFAAAIGEQLNESK